MPAKENFIADDVQLLKRKIVNEFLTDIGINNTNLDKRERLTDDEVNANNVETVVNIKLWKQNVEKCCKYVNAMFPDAKLEITFPYYREPDEVVVSGTRPDVEGGEDNESD